MHRELFEILRHRDTTYAPYFRGNDEEARRSSDDGLRARKGNTEQNATKTLKHVSPVKADCYGRMDECNLSTFLLGRLQIILEERPYVPVLLLDSVLTRY